MKSKSKSKILSLLLAVIMVIGLMPVSVGAVEAGSTSDLSLRGPVAVSGAASSYQCIYYGGYKWRILEKSNSELFLLSDGIVTNMPFRNMVEWQPNEYYISQVRMSFLGDNGIFYGYFTQKERSAFNENGNKDGIYLLSVNEINSYTYFPGGNADRASSGSWWLRSPSNVSNVCQISFVANNGSVNSAGCPPLANNGVRPAFRLNLSSVLFASAAGGGASATEGSNLAAVTPPTGDLKLTLADSSQTLTIGDVTAVSCASGSAVTVNYSSAATSASNYLCAELTSGGNTYRGVIKALTAGSESGTAAFNLPVDITPGSYTLKLWNEQYNAANCTNYASTPVSKSISFSNPIIVSTSSTLPTGIIGTAYTAAALTATGGTGSYTWSATGLPAGFGIDQNTGVISGTPTDTGAYSVTVTVTDTNSKTGTATFNLPVYSMANITPTITVVNGVAFSATIYNTYGTLTGTSTSTTYGTLTGTASGNDTVISGTLTGVPTTLTDLPLGKGTIKIRAVDPPATTLNSPSFY